MATPRRLVTPADWIVAISGITFLGDEACQEFRTPTGKVELYSERLAGLGLDPLPDFVPPAGAAVTGRDPEYPLLLQTGMREKSYHHSRFREQGWARKVSPDPSAHLHPDDAARYGITDGDWIWVETTAQSGRCRLKTRINDQAPSGVLVTGMGWWRPEGPGPDYGALDININAALSYGVHTTR